MGKEQSDSTAQLKALQSIDKSLQQLAREQLDSKTQQEALQSIAISLQQIANGLTILAIQSSHLEEQSLTENIILLNRWGFDRHRIASILKTTPNTVSARLSEARKASKKG